MKTETNIKKFNDNNYDINKNLNEKFDFNSNISTDEISINLNNENFFEEKIIDFEIPNFFNDKPKIFFINHTIFPIIPEWYKNLNKFELNFSSDDESLFK